MHGICVVQDLVWYSSRVNTKETAKEQHPVLPPLCSYTTRASDECRPLSGPVEASSSPVHWNAVVLSKHTRLFILRLCEKPVRQPHPWHLVSCLLRLNPTALSSHNSQKSGSAVQRRTFPTQGPSQPASVRTAALTHSKADKTFSKATWEKLSNTFTCF